MQNAVSRSCQPGDRVSVDRSLYRHVGIVSGRLADGRIAVISASKRRGVVVEEAIDEFAGGRTVRNDGLRSELRREVVVERARAAIGQPWRLFANCEHLASSAEGKVPSSPQLAGWTVGLVVGGLLLLGSGKRSA